MDNLHIKNRAILFKGFVVNRCSTVEPELGRYLPSKKRAPLGGTLTSVSSAGMTAASVVKPSGKSTGVSETSSVKPPSPDYR